MELLIGIIKREPSKSTVEIQQYKKPKSGSRIPTILKV